MITKYTEGKVQLSSKKLQGDLFVINKKNKTQGGRKFCQQCRNLCANKYLVPDNCIQVLYGKFDFFSTDKVVSACLKRVILKHNFCCC